MCIQVLKLKSNFNIFSPIIFLLTADSDDETVFGDDEEDGDLFSRLEQQREELEGELGFEKFINIYKTVQVRAGTLLKFCSHV